MLICLGTLGTFVTNFLVCMVRTSWTSGHLGTHPERAEDVMRAFYVPTKHSAPFIALPCSSAALRFQQLFKVPRYLCVYCVMS